jgi:hypothetical protein
MYARTNRAGFQKTPVTLRDNTNEGGGTMFGLVIVPLTVQCSLRAPKSYHSEKRRRSVLTDIYYLDCPI